MVKVTNYHSIIKNKKISLFLWKFLILPVNLIFSQPNAMQTDLTYLKEMSGGNKDLIREMITIFQTQVEEFARDM
jgi:hypothetical protein